MRWKDVVRLIPNGPRLLATYEATQTLHSFALPGLTVAVADIFRAL